MELKDLLTKMVKDESSDLHLKVGIPPVYRIDGRLTIMKTDSLTPDDLKKFALQLMNRRQAETFDKAKELDFAVGIAGLGRFRVNAYVQRGSVALSLRAVPMTIRHVEELNLPPVLKEMAVRPRGLILLTGTTGSGKSTTLAAMLEHINENVSQHIITIEDPIEFLFKDKTSIISQRELGTDTESFGSALKHILRQDPDVILIGEIRDKATMDTALKAADTGHLVMSTLHTLNATETINRIISFYPPHQHQHVRVLLSATLVGVVSQRLLPRVDGHGRIPAVEVLLATPTVRDYILDPVNTQLIGKAIEEGSQYQMQSFDQSIMKLYKDNLIDYETALQYVSNPDEFRLRLRGIKSTADRGWQDFEV
jgi:twitching motility protein PilT